MSLEDGSITLPLGGEEQTFRLAYGQFRELQESINMPRIAIGAPVLGPLELGEALRRGAGWPHDAREVIRLGLIGGGMKPDRALVLVKRHVENRPFYPSMLLAVSILYYALVGPPDDPVGKEPAPAEPETPAINGSGFPQSTGSALQ